MYRVKVKINNHGETIVVEDYYVPFGKFAEIGYDLDNYGYNDPAHGYTVELTFHA